MIIEIEHSLEDAIKFLTVFSKKELVRAHRRALNRTATGLRKEATIAIKKELRLKSGNIKAKRLRVRKATGSRFEQLEAALEFSGDPVPMIEFVRGSKKPRDQKGKPVKRRRLISVEIKPGKKFKLKHGFIATVRSQQIFKRSSKGKSKLKKQGIRAVSTLPNIDAFRSPLERYIRTRYEREIAAALKFAINKAAGAAGGGA